ncbi:MAG: T9SS type A sorting domain-containing protein [Planctomycetes bacterium]|nr:T9SS type A sorting domain-containing protein [Planctomycetota bacterium]
MKVALKFLTVFCSIFVLTISLNAQNGSVAIVAPDSDSPPSKDRIIIDTQFNRWAMLGENNGNEIQILDNSVDDPEVPDHKDAQTGIRTPAHNICEDIGENFSFGLSIFSAAGNWIVEASQAPYNIDWRFGYFYISQITTESAARYFIHLRSDTAEEAGAIPVITFYRLLNIGEDEGYTGNEAQIVQSCLQDQSAMYTYFENMKIVLSILAERDNPSIVQVEPDSWGFMMWAMGIQGNDDATTVPVQVNGSGHPDVQGFSNHAGGFGQALLHMRDMYAPEVRMGWHASNFRVGQNPEVVTGFYSSMGDWDVIFSEPPHMVTLGDSWCEPWNEVTQVPNNLNWLSTVSQSAGVPILIWQTFIGEDYHYFGDWPNNQLNLSRMAEAGVAGMMFHHLGNGDPDDFIGYSQGPPCENIDGTAADLRDRLIDYTSAPLLLPDGTPCGTSGPGIIRFETVDFSASESALTATITVVRASGNEGPATVNYSSSDGSATAGSDYSPAGGSLTWNDGESGSKTFTVSILPDETIEGDETVNLTLSGVTGASLGNPNTAVLTIEDDDLDIFDVRINNSSDDAEEGVITGGMYLNSSDLEIIQDGSVEQMVGVRFNDVTIPQGAAIFNAYIQFQVDETSSSSTMLTIHGHDIDYAPAFTTAANNISSRAATAASVNWNPPAWDAVGAAGVDQRTTSITPVIQEITNRPGWTSGNSLAIMISGSGSRVADSYDGDPSGAPLLHLEYATGTSVPTMEVSPNSSEQNQNITMTITGTDTHFQDGSGISDVRLTQGASFISGTNINPISNTSVTVDFAIPAGAFVGQWDVIVTTDVDGAVTLQDGLTVNLGQPTDLTATAQSIDQIELSWINQSATQTSIRIERKQGLGGTFIQTAEVDGSQNTYTDSELTEATLYCYRILAFDGIVLTGYTSESCATTLSQIRVQFESSASSVATENDIPHPIGLTLVMPDGGSLTEAVAVQVIDNGSGSATSGLDYQTFATQIATFPIGSTDGAVQTVTLNVLADNIVEMDETVYFYLGQVSGPAITGTPTSHVITIPSDDTANIGFQSILTVTPDESNSAYQIPVELSIPGDGSLGSPVSISAIDLGGTATDGSDYSLSEPLTVTFPIGAANGATANFTANIIQDELLEGPESFILQLDNPTDPATLNTQTSHILTITDDELSTVEFQLGASVVAIEGQTGFEIEVILTVPVSSSLPTAVTVDVIDTGSGSATGNGVDYIFSGPVTITFPIGAMNGHIIPVSINTFDDSDVEANETINLELANITGPAVLGGQLTHVVTINDNDQAGVAFSSANSSTDAEFGEHPMELTLTVPDGGTLYTDLTVDIIDTDTGTAIRGFDYAFSGFHSVTFPSGSTTGTIQTFSIQINADNAVEGNENIVLELDSVTGPGLITAPATHEIVIDDDDPATVSFASGSSIVPNESAVGHTIDVVLYMPGGGSLAMPISVNVTDLQTGTATSGVDYSAFVTQTLIFPSASLNGATQSVTFDVTEDGTVEQIETVNLQLLNLTGPGSIAPNPGHEISIVDDDAGMVQFQADVSATVNESESSHPVPVMLSLPGGGSLPQDVTVDVIDQDTGSADSGLDYASFGSQTVVFPAGSSDGALQFAYLDVLADLVVETDETVNLQLINVNGPGVLGTRQTHEVTITDDDNAQIAFQYSESAVTDQTDTSILIDIVLSLPGGGILAEPVTATVTDVGTGTATGGVDYQAFGTQVIDFPAGSVDGAGQSVMLNILADNQVEGLETIDFELDLTSGSAQLGAQTTHQVRISEQSTAAVSFQVAETTTPDENATAYNISVSLTIPGDASLGQALSVDVTDSGTGSAESGSDYANFGSQTLTFPAGSNNGTVRNAIINITDDTISEATETVDLQLSNVTEPGTSGAQTTHIVNISDDDPAEISFQATASNTDESDHDHSVPLVLSVPGGGTLPQEVTVYVRDSGNGTAYSGIDYIEFGFQVLTFAAGSADGSIQPVTLSVLSDNNAEDSETVALEIFNTSGHLHSVNPVDHVVTINESDGVTVSFQSVVSATINESAVLHQVAIELSVSGGASLAQSVSVDVTDVGGTALTGIDYANFGTQTVTFAQGSTDGATQVVVINIYADLILEANETIDLELSNPAEPASLGAQTNHQVTITDDDPATIGFESASSSSIEDTAPHQVQLILNAAGGGSVPQPIIVEVNDTGNGTAVAGVNSDYAAFGTQQVTFPAGATDGTIQSAIINLQDDTEVEGDETIELQLGTVNGHAVLGAQTSHSVTIYDDEMVSVSFQADAGTTQNEGPPAHQIPVELSIPVGSSIASPVTVEVAVIGGSATNLEDYALGGTQPLTFPAGTSPGNNDVQMVVIDVADDADPEGDETIELQLQNLTGSANYGILLTHTVTIPDDDAATVAFQSAASATGDESNGNHDFFVVLSIPGAGVLSQPVSVNVNDSDAGSATGGIDYTFVGPQVLTFPAGSVDGASQNASLAVSHDDLIEGDETVYFQLANISGPAILSGQLSHEVMIVDDETMANISFALLNSVTPNENTAVHEVSILMTTVLGEFLSAEVQVNVIDITGAGPGSATAGQDYDLLNTQVAFPAGATNGTLQMIAVQIWDDNFLEGDETLTLQIDQVSGTAVPVNPLIHNIIITDSDDPCATGDDDGDGICNDVDNCPDIPNSDQTNTDGDTEGDACDNDDDNDGVDDPLDQCPLDNPDDTDGDGICDSDDPCPLDNPDDTDEDGICDSDDDCPGFDDSADADNDGVPDGCDLCPGFDDTADGDSDNVPDGCDICNGHDDSVDTDGDSVPNGCDVCDGFDDAIDSDGDDVPDGCDACPGYDDANDNDGDGAPDDCDTCPGFDDTADDDGDGIADGCDDCPGFDDNADDDGDGVADGCDACPGFNDNNDDDGDGVADGCDACPGFDDSLDDDGDSVPDDCDICPGYDDTVDTDEDGHPDGCDNCPFVANSGQEDGDGNGIGDACEDCDTYNVVNMRFINRFWHCISTPVDLNEPQVQDLFPGMNPIVKTRDCDGRNLILGPTDPLLPGKGYFVNIRNYPSITLPFEGCEIVSPLVVEKCGSWARFLTGNPYPEAINLSNFVLDPIDSPYQIWVFYRGRFRRNMSPVPVGAAVYIVTPAQRVLIYRNTPTAISIPVNDPDLAGGSYPAADEWLLDLEVKSDNLEMSSCTMGIGKNYSDGYDPYYDLPEMLSMSVEYVRISFPHDWSETDVALFNSDLRSPATDKTIWDIQVETNARNQDIDLSWPNLENLPRNMQFTLLDLENNREINMRQQQEYIYRHRQAKVHKRIEIEKYWPEDSDPFVTFDTPLLGKVYSFRVIFTKNDDVSVTTVTPSHPKWEYRLEQNRPNPFSPLTTITFEIPAWEHVSLRIYNITGQLVKTLQNGMLEAGRYDVTWDATGSSNERVTAGAYFYRIQAGPFAQTRRMILMR